MVLVNSVQTKSANLTIVLICHVILVLIYTVFAVIRRPYRCKETNILYSIAMIGLTLEVIVLLTMTILKKADIIDDLVDLIATASVFGIVLMGLIITMIVIACVDHRWPIDYSLVEGKELAIA